MLSGLDLAKQTVGVLLRFREEPVAVIGDIEAMCNQVNIPVKQINFIWFLWWINSDTQNEVVDHDVTAHVFGCIYSPSCWNYALKKTAVGNVKKYGNKAWGFATWK